MAYTEIDVVNLHSSRFARIIVQGCIRICKRQFFPGVWGYCHPDEEEEPCISPDQTIKEKKLIGHITVVLKKAQQGQGNSQQTTDVNIPVYIEKRNCQAYQSKKLCKIFI